MEKKRPAGKIVGGEVVGKLKKDGKIKEQLKKGEEDAELSRISTLPPKSTMINTSSTITKTPQTLTTNIPKFIPPPPSTATKKRKQKYQKLKKQEKENKNLKILKNKKFAKKF